MFIIDDIISWIVGRVLDRLFPNRNSNEKLIEELNKRVTSLQDDKEKLTKDSQKDKETRETEKRKILDSLKRRGLSVDKLIQKYDEPLLAILISYASQKEKQKSGYYKDSHFLRSELEKYNSKYLGGTDVLIPPVNVPHWIKNNVDLRKWFEKEILKGRFCKIKYLALIDLKKDAYWETYLPYEQKKPMHFTIGEVLGIKDVFSEAEINKISLSQIIRDGDIGWLASTTITGDELDLILKNQTMIEHELMNPSLRILSGDDMVPKLSAVLKPFIQKPDKVAKEIVQEAKFWEAKLR